MIMAHSVIFLVFLVVFALLFERCNCVSEYEAFDSSDTILPRQVEVPTIANFRWRALQSSKFRQRPGLA